MIFERITMLQIDYFMAVARHLNFTKAAKSVYVSQPSLSRQVALLENEVGVQLFHRGGKGAELTSAGSLLYEDLSTIKQQLKVAFENARQSTFCSYGVVKIGCLETMETDSFLPQMIDRINRHCPSADVSLEQHSFKPLRDMLINGSLDIIFTLSFEIDDSFDVCSRVVHETTMSIFMSTSHPLATRSKLSIADLKNENFIMIDRNESPRGADMFIEICAKYGFSPNIVKQVPNPESLLLNIKSGIGLSIMDSAIFLRNREAYRVFNIPEIPMSIVMVWKEKDQLKAEQLFDA